MKARQLALASLVGLSGCATTVKPVASYVTLDTTVADECRAHCEKLGMDLGAVVIIVNSTGCVCQPRGKPIANAAGATGVAGAVIVQAAASQQQEQRQHHD